MNSGIRHILAFEDFLDDLGQIRLKFSKSDRFHKAKLLIPNQLVKLSSSGFHLLPILNLPVYFARREVITLISWIFTSQTTTTAS